MATIDGLLERALTLEDIPGALFLSEEAGWNQNVRDWQLLLTHGTGFGLVSENGRLVATAVTLPHGDRLAWVSMVLVAGSFRKRGLATHLLQSCIDSLSSRSLIPVLDATDEGKVVYGKIGFKPLYGLQRMVCREAFPAHHHEMSGFQPMSESDLSRVLLLDRSLFGADRSAVLRHLFERQRGRAHVLLVDEQVKGYVMAREGDHALHMGPIIAPSAQTAFDMTTVLLENTAGPVYIDTLDSHETFQQQLRKIGFVTQRSFTRMALGELGVFDQPDHIFASVGPELG